MPGFLRRLLIGRPIPTSEAKEHRLGNFAALAVFASDALSSVAYATQEILLVLVLAGPAALYLTTPIAGAISVLLIILVISYRQTIHAYPTGGGAYTVAKENLGVLPSLVAGAALLVDYVLTVAVSVSAGVAAITSAVPALYEHRIALALISIAVIMWGNLRGVRESGYIFGAPTYGFIFAIVSLVVVGLIQYAFGDTVGFVGGEPPLAHHDPSAFRPLTMLLILKAFSSGCAAVTGVEAISNGLMAFRKPEAENAVKVLRWLAIILAFMFLGISVLAKLYGVLPDDRETLISQIAREVFGSGAFYYFIQVSTFAILILAANTSFADFPRLASLMAQDSFMPRQLKALGDRLVFSNGILLLAGAAGALTVLFDADTHQLIPLYAVGVFASFTLSQSGAVVHHFRLRELSWRRHAAVNLIGAMTTLVVLGAILITKFFHGAWLVCLVIPILITWFYAVRGHYRNAAKQLVVDMDIAPRQLRHKIIVPVSGIHRGVLVALEYARSLSPHDVRAVTVAVDDRTTNNLVAQWEKWAQGVPLDVIRTPYRSLTEPLVEYIERAHEEEPDDLLTVVIPSFVTARWWHNFLHNQSSMFLQAALRGMRNVVVTSVRTHLDK